MALFRRHRRWRAYEGRRRNSNWLPYWETDWRPRRYSFGWLLRDFLIRLVAFSILCALGLAWVKYHFLEGLFTPSF